MAQPCTITQLLTPDQCSDPGTGTAAHCTLKPSLIPINMIVTHQNYDIKHHKLRELHKVTESAGHFHVLQIASRFSSFKILPTNINRSTFNSKSKLGDTRDPRPQTKPHPRLAESGTPNQTSRNGTLVWQCCVPTILRFDYHNRSKLYNLKVWINHQSCRNNLE